MERGREAYIKPHRHECHELVFYEEGTRGVADIGDMEYGIVPASVLLARRGTVHGERHSGDGKVVFLGFESPNLTLGDGLWRDMGILRPLFHDIVREMKEQEWGYEGIISIRIREILVRLERRNHKSQGSVQNLEYCRQYLEENYMQQVSVGELAEMCGYSRDRFRHLFAEKFGEFPRHYLMNLRLEGARRLLQTTDYTCTDIAQMCGFTDNCQMTKMMKKKYGMTPKGLRGNKSAQIQLNHGRNYDIMGRI